MTNFTYVDFPYPAAPWRKNLPCSFSAATKPITNRFLSSSTSLDHNSSPSMCRTVVTGGGKIRSQLKLATTGIGDDASQNLPGIFPIST